MFVVEKPHIDYTSHAEVKICKFEECESAGHVSLFVLYVLFSL